MRELDVREHQRSPVAPESSSRSRTTAPSAGEAGDGGAERAVVALNDGLVRHAADARWHIATGNRECHAIGATPDAIAGDQAIAAAVVDLGIQDGQRVTDALPEIVEPFPVGAITRVDAVELPLQRRARALR